MNLLYIDLLFLSDGCLAGGTVAGAGDVDTSIEVDKAGLPILRGRALKGLVVEEAALILQAIPSLVAVAEALFGSPSGFGTTSVLSFRDGGLPGDLPEKIRGWNFSTVRQACTVVRRQTRIDVKTGAASTGSLRGTRLLRAGITLRAPLACSRDLDSSEKGLLAAAVASVRRVGLHRNEGWGRVRARLRDAEGRDLLQEWLPYLEITNTPTPAVPAPSPPHFPPSGPARVELELELNNPLLLADQDGSPWVVSSLPYVSGSTLLGEAANRWLAINPTADAAADPAFRRLFLDGGCRWLNAYPEMDGQRSLPLPLSFRRPKQGGNQGVDLAAEDGFKKVKDKPDEGWKKIESAFWVPQNEWVVPQRQQRMHHQRDREQGRPVAGNIFLYDALASGQRFRTSICCEQGADAELLATLLDGTILQLGRARTAGYGGAVKVRAQRRPASPDFEIGNLPDIEDRLILTLLSDYLGIDDAGNPDPMAVLGDLGEILGFDLLKLQAQGRVTLHAGYRQVSGQVAKWRMPRPTSPALCAGSVVVVRGVEVEPAALKRLLWEGIGLRRAEGFGRVGVGIHGDQTEPLLRQRKIQRKQVVTPIFPGDAEAWSALQMALSQRLARRHLTQLGEEHARTLRVVPPSLVSRLRQQVRLCADLPAFQAFLATLQGKKAGKQLERVWRGSRRLTDWLEGLGTWRQWPELQQVSMLDLPVLPPEQDWSLLQGYLDALLETWRRRAAKEQG